MDAFGAVCKKNSDTPADEDIYTYVEIIETDISSLCRICGNASEEEHLVNVYPEGGNRDDSNFAETIMTYLPIKVSADDVLPVKICASCNETILRWHNFYECCVEADKKFQAMLIEEKNQDNEDAEGLKTIIGNGTPKKSESEEVFDDMAVSSIAKAEYEIPSDEDFAPYSETDSEPEMETDTPKKNRIFKSRQTLSCTFCKTSPKSKIKLNEHLKRKHSNQIFHCDICNQITPRLELIAHMTAHALESCKKSAQQKSPQKTDNKLTCIKCNKTFTHINGIKYHMNAVHAKIKEYKCDTCDKSFACERILSNHKKSIHLKVRSFKCEICGKMYKTDSTLFAHKKIHLNECPFKCDVCEKKFKFKHHLTGHMAQHSAVKMYSCNICHKTFAMQNNLSKHKKTHSTSLDFGCHICGVKMRQRRYLQEHMKRVHQTTLIAATSTRQCQHLEVICLGCNSEMINELSITALHVQNCGNDPEIQCKICRVPAVSSSDDIECQICGETFLNKADLRKHTATHQEITCYDCSKTFKNESSLKAHRKLHLGLNQNFACPVCGLSMNRKYNMLIHVSSHNADFPCKICCASFNSVALLDHHKLTHTAEEIENYSQLEHKVECNSCTLLFDSRYKLYMHTLAEHSTDEKKVICHCGRIFENEVMLANHQKSHTDAMYTCDICNKKFKQLKGLEEHQNTHLDNRPYQCETCGKKFRYSSNLSQHRTMHKGVKNFTCPDCGKKFLRSNTLATHLRSHKNIRKHVCQHCGASFIQSSSLLKHKRSMHRSCDRCGKMVGNRTEWQIHVWKKCTDSVEDRAGFE